MADDKLAKVVQPVALAMSDDDVNSYLQTGDFGKIPPPMRGKFLYMLALRWGLDPLTKPFQLIEAQGKIILYVTRAATDQLSEKHQISTKCIEEGIVQVGDSPDSKIYRVKYRAWTPGGRKTEDVGAVYIGKQVGEAASNLVMKAHTKGKRRAILSFVGLSLPDESEVPSIPGIGQPLPVTVYTPKEVPPGDVPEDLPIKPPVPVERT